MVVQNQTVTFVTGDFHDITCVVTDLDGGGPLNLTGKSVEFDAGNRVVLKNSSQGASGVEITDAVNGEFTVHLRSSDTVSVRQNIPFSIRVIESNGNFVTVATGTINVIPIN